MIEACHILNAIEGGDIEPAHDGSNVTILFNLKPVLTVPLVPLAQVRKTIDNMVNVFSGDILVATVQADSEADTEEIAATFGFLLGPVESE